MENRVIVADRPDALDLEAFETMTESPSFQRFIARITQELDRARTDCETEVGDPGIRRAQGRCAALRMVAGLPSQMLKELRARKV